ncbi:MAG: AMP-binding protein [Myxococcales bacterium]
MNQTLQLPRSFAEGLERLRDRGTQPALVVPDGGPVFTRLGLLEAVERLACSLRGALGAFAADSPVALALPNGVEFLVCFLALARLGRAVMPLNPVSTRDLALGQLLDGEACGLLALAEDSEASVQAARQAARQLGLSVWEVRATLTDVELVGQDATGALPAAVGSDNVALLLQTSGTTGKAKWVPLTQGNIMASVETIVSGYGLGPSDVSLLVMPLFHVHGLIGVAFSTLFSGGVLVTPRRFSAGNFWEWVSKHRPSWYSAVPTIHQILLERSEIGTLPRQQFRFVRSCSSPLLPGTLAAMESRMEVPVLQAYGMTEAAHQIASQALSPAPRTPGSVGHATGVELAIFDADGRCLPSGEAGEVVLRGEKVMGGYRNNPAANATAFVRGWFRTGDIGRLEADGCLTLVGRIKEMINRAGEKIAPSQVDTVLLDAPGVRQAVTFGVPDATYGEVVHAAVVCGDGGSAEGVLRFCREKLPAFMVPIRLHVVETIPTGATGKISRGQMPRLLGLIP